MNLPRKFFLLLKEIGIADLVSYSRYQLELRSGLLKKRTPHGGNPTSQDKLLFDRGVKNSWHENWVKSLFSNNATLPQEETLLLLKGDYRPFSHTQHPLDLTLGEMPLQHWTAYINEFDHKDIKFTWEPARFSWSLALARAYAQNPDEKYAEIFWAMVEEFTAHNPVNTGPNWASAQEISLRAINWILASAAFEAATASTPARQENMRSSIAQHIARIQPTLNYARSQHNNHLLSEALGLLIGGDFLGMTDPRAEGWTRQGIHWFENALIDQIDDEGNYAQHSSNYHRMLLNLALIYEAWMRNNKQKIPEQVRKKLSLATCWLVSQLEPSTGYLPNLGHNDGTLILPFGCTEYRDYRPVAQAASIAFLGKPCLPPGTWDELTSWLGLEHERQAVTQIEVLTSPAIHKVGDVQSRGMLRGVQFRNRPAHADQLHAEIWWQGINLARDAGTYLYNAPPPWQNGLDSTRVHNTVTIDQRDQMHRISRFLWLDQAQATWLKSALPDTVIASHNGYRRIGIIHQRSLSRTGSGFRVTDTLTPKTNDNQSHDYCLHWLLPDWSWSITDGSLTLHHEQYHVMLDVKAYNPASAELKQPGDVSIIRGGGTLTGQRKDDLLGWESDTYNEKHPALSFLVTFSSHGPIEIVTEWVLTDESS